jgi:glycosyltransferase involved in cell wall biosynthesis
MDNSSNGQEYDNSCNNGSSPTYFVIVTCRNSEKNIGPALASLKKQTVKPSYIIVIDDGSTDKTPQILSELQAQWNSLHIITNPNLGYDISRVVSNWNKALVYAQKKNLPYCDYHMIATDDTVYESQYAERIMKHMMDDEKVAIASGEYSSEKHQTPHGAGRFVRNKFFENMKNYPEKMGYESAILFMCAFSDYTYKVYPDARFDHTRPLGKNHHFSEFGASMKTLGYHPLLVLGRTALYFITGKPIGRAGALYMLYHYLTFKPSKNGYYSSFDKTFQRKIRAYQSMKIKHKVIRMLHG